MTGAIVLATDQGLGYLARDFFKNGLINKVYIHPHSSRINHRDWYPGSAVVATIDQLIEECDTIFAIETFFDWKTIIKAREKGKKTVLMPMYECTPNPLPYVPDVILAPSLLDLDYYPNAKLVTVPVDVPSRIRRKAKVFVHNAGNGGLGGRNGTRELLEALQHVKSPIKLILRVQNQKLLEDLPSALKQQIEEDDRIEVRIGTFDDIWDEGDVFIFPEKFNGLSLPIQEAFASGMLVMATDRHPFNKWLPQEPLLPVDNYKTERLAVEFQIAQLSPEAIAKHIDFWFNKDITKFSELGITWGQAHSWKLLKNEYQEVLK